MDYNNVNNGGNIPGQNMQGMPNQRMPMQGTPGQGMPMQGAPGQGMPMQGAPGQGMPMQGAPGQRMPMQGAPGQRMPMQGAPGQRMPMQGAPNQRMPMQGAPGQGMPAGRMPQQGMRGAEAKGNMPMQGNPGQSSAGDAPRVRSRHDLPPMSESGQEKDKTRLFGEEGGKGIKHLSAGLSGITGYIYGGILILCLVISLIVYGTSHHGTGGKKYSIPTDMITYTGIFRDIYERAASGSLGTGSMPSGTLYDEDGTEVPAAPTAIGEAPGTDSAVGEGGSQASSSDGATSGATMELDSGNGTGSYGQAESYKELLSQIESAIASGDTDFVGRKFAYEDEDGSLKGYPQSVVDHFVTYMSTNSDKRDALMSELSSDKYQGQNEDAFIVKLPYIKFVVNMGYDNTTISLPGFSDQVVNAGQSADIAPLLPCMYTLTISNPEWSEPVTRDIEANVNEATISINIKP